MYVYECPLGHHRYWYREYTEGGILCEVCGGSCHPVDEFTYNPFDFQAPDRLEV